MDNISRVMARIDSIRAQVGMPASTGAFAAVLDTQMATGSSDMVARGGVRAASSVPGAATTFVPPPTGVITAAELDAYVSSHALEDRNGRLDSSELTQITGGWGERNYALIPPAAAAYEQMRAAAAADGIDLQVIDAYRSWEVQAGAYEDYLAGRKKEHVLPPGTSEHGKGMAVDFTDGAIIGTDDPAWHWLQQNAHRYGWYPISNETWHWEFRGLGA